MSYDLLTWWTSTLHGHESPTRVPVWVNMVKVNSLPATTRTSQITDPPSLLYRPSNLIYQWNIRYQSTNRRLSRFPVRSLTKSFPLTNKRFLRYRNEVFTSRKWRQEDRTERFPRHVVVSDGVWEARGNLDYLGFLNQTSESVETGVSFVLWKLTSPLSNFIVCVYTIYNGDFRSYRVGHYTENHQPLRFKLLEVNKQGAKLPL